MKKLVVGFIALLALAAFTSMVFAAGAPKTEPAKAESKVEMKAETVTGTIAMIEKAKNEVVLKVNKGVKTFVVMPGEIEKLKVGEKVKIEVEKGTDKVEKIEVLKK